MKIGHKPKPRFELEDWTDSQLAKDIINDLKETIVMKKINAPKWAEKPVLSTKHVVIIVAAIAVLRYLLDHLIIGWK